MSKTPATAGVVLANGESRVKEGYKSIKRKHREALAAFERARDSKKEN